MSKQPSINDNSDENVNLSDFFSMYYPYVMDDYDSHEAVWDAFIMPNRIGYYMLYQQLNDIKWDPKRILKLIEESDANDLVFNLDDPEFHSWINRLKSFLVRKVREEGFEELLDSEPGLSNSDLTE